MLRLITPALSLRFISRQTSHCCILKCSRINMQGSKITDQEERVRLVTLRSEAILPNSFLFLRNWATTPQEMVSLLQSRLTAWAPPFNHLPEALAFFPASLPPLSHLGLLHVGLQLLRYIEAVASKLAFLWFGLEEPSAREVNKPP